MRVFIIAALIVAAFGACAHAEEVKPAFTLTADQAAIIAQWASEKKATAQQVYTQADGILADLQKQATKSQEPAKK